MENRRFELSGDHRDRKTRLDAELAAAKRAEANAERDVEEASDSLGRFTEEVNEAGRRRQRLDDLVKQKQAAEAEMEDARQDAETAGKRLAGAIYARPHNDETGVIIRPAQDRRERYAIYTTLGILFVTGGLLALFGRWG